jgi:hypothetical protein
MPISVGTVVSIVARSNMPSSGPSVFLSSIHNGHNMSLANTTLVACVIWTRIVLSVIPNFPN